MPTLGHRCFRCATSDRFHHYVHITVSRSRLPSVTSSIAPLRSRPRISSITPLLATKDLRKEHRHPFQASSRTRSPGLSRRLGMVIQRKLRHGAHPVLQWVCRQRGRHPRPGRWAHRDVTFLRWLDDIVIGGVTGVEQIAAPEQCSVRQVNMTISLAFLAPDLVKAAIDGRLPHGMGVARLCDLPAEWSRQRGLAAL